MTHIHGEEKQSLETVPKEVQTLDSLDKNFKEALKNMLSELRESMSKELKKKIRQ